VRAVATVALVCGVLSCGGGAKDPPAKCGEVVSRFCARVVACLNDGTSQADCVTITRVELPCARAESVTDSYDACAAELQTAECSVLAPNQLFLPATCRAAFVFEPGP